jgi:hypothetical protein
MGAISFLRITSLEKLSKISFDKFLSTVTSRAAGFLVNNIFFMACINVFIFLIFHISPLCPIFLKITCSREPLAIV